ncbi:MAG TPA: P63C domain-containing protein [Candidatus Acidoferrales bacterium]|jgi:hypothetical protein|nr:P63C domain-containing protein [Candidatus Acidoferrales bacterium]
MVDENKDAMEAAKALSALGAAKGGLARAKNMTASERSDSARAAVQARWAKAGKESIQRATHLGELKIGDAALPCAVLEDGTRVLTQWGFYRAIGRSGRPAGGWGSDVEKVAPFLDLDNLKPYVSVELAASKPIQFELPRGTKAWGYKAELLPKVCEVYLKARAEEKLLKSQLKFAKACEILTRGLAHVGIIALIDEATGYQDERARDALAQILEAFIAKELRPWVQTFSPEFYKEMFRLRNIPYRADVKRPQYIGVLTNDLVYSRLAPGVLDELRKKTPRDEKGRLKTHLHRRLTEDVGHPKLQQHLSAVTALMKASDSWEQFKPMVDRALPKYKRLPLFDGLESKEAKK